MNYILHTIREAAAEMRTSDMIGIVCILIVWLGLMFIAPFLIITI
jgi:spore maturation protein SpmA